MKDYAGYLVPECVDCKYWRDGSKYDLGCGYIFYCDHLKPKQLTLFEKDDRLHKYMYDGPVIVHDEWLANWRGITIAVSEAKARNNLTYQWKITHGYPPNSNVILPSVLTMVE